MRLTELSNQQNVMSRKAMNITFGGHTFISTGCNYSGSAVSDCSDGIFDY